MIKIITIDFVFRIAQLNEVGLIQFWRRKVMEQIKPKHPANRFQLSSSVSIKPEPTLAPFRLEDFYSMFLVYLVGITLSVLVFTYEVVFHLTWRRFFGNRVAGCP